MNKFVVHHVSTETYFDLHFVLEQTNQIPEQWRHSAKIKFFIHDGDGTVIIGYTRPEFPEEEVERIIDKIEYLDGITIN